MIKAFCKPRIKVGTEWVTKSQTWEQATGAVGGIARAIFDRLFKWLIEKCNDTLIDPTLKKANFCAVLDIAGFEIFEYNGFEQISINFVNEKLFKAIVFKDLKPSNVKHSTKVCLLKSRI